MTSGTEHRIEHLEPGRDHRMLVTWSTGERTPVDVADEVARGGIWAALRDERIFARARVAHGGAVLEWPEPAGKNGEPRIDIDADGLFCKAMQQRDALAA